MLKFITKHKLSRKTKTTFLPSFISLLSLLPIVTTISNGELNPQKTTQNNSSTQDGQTFSLSKFGQKNSELLLKTIEILEFFLVEIKSFYTKGNAAIKQIERLKSLVAQRQRIYNGSTLSEVMIYLFGFKWLWGIFTGYRSTYIGPAYAELMTAKDALQANYDLVNSLKEKLFGQANKAKSSIQRIFGLEGRSVTLNLSLQKIRTKLNLLDTEFTYLVERIADEERNELSFQNALESGRQSEFQEQTIRTTIDSNENNLSGNYTSEFSNGLDQTTRHIWEKAEVDRFQERRQELKEETQNARKTFENTKTIEKLIEILQEELVK